MPIPVQMMQVMTKTTGEMPFCGLGVSLGVSGSVGDASVGAVTGKVSVGVVSSGTLSVFKKASVSSCAGARTAVTVYSDVEPSSAVTVIIIFVPVAGFRSLLLLVMDTDALLSAGVPFKLIALTS